MAGSERARGRAGPNLIVAEAVSLAVASAAVGAVYLWIYVSKHFVFPVGYDTPKYVWRSALVGARGVSALAGAAPQPFRSNPDRAGFPVLIDAVASLLRVSVPRLAMVLPAVMAATIGLGAAAFARTALSMPRWAAPLFVVAVGASANVSRMGAPGYLDNILVTGLVMGGVTVAIAAARRRGAGPPWGAVGLLTAAVLTHWIFVAVVAAMLLAVAALALPGSLRAWREDRRPLGTPSGRLAGIVGGAAVLGGAALLTLVGSEPNPPRLPLSTFTVKLASDVPRYVLPVTGPLAAIGAAWAAVTLDARGRLRRLLRRSTSSTGSNDPSATGAALGRWLMLVWALSGPVAAVALAIGLAVPAHRFLAFDLGIPLLVACGLVAVGRLLAGAGAPIRLAIAAAVVAVALAGTTTIAFRAWSGGKPWIPTKQFEQAGIAASYLQQVGGSRPVVFIVDLGGAQPIGSTSEAFHVIRTAIAPQDVRRTFEYLGTAENFLAGRPTLRGQPAFDQASLQHWPSVRAALSEGPIAILMGSFVKGFRSEVSSHPDWRIAPGVAVVQGPRPTGPLPPLRPVPQPPGGFALVALWVAFLLVLAAAGSGWSTALLHEDPAVRLALAPAFGIAAVILGGVIADRAGLRLGGGDGGLGGAIVVALVAAAGWVVFGIAWLRRR